MNKTVLYIKVIVAFSFLTVATFTPSVGQQARNQSIESKIDVLATEIQNLDNLVTISVSEVSIQEFVRGIAKNSKLNINVDPEINVNISANYSQVKISDILKFICKKYNLDISATGNIISIIKYADTTPVKTEKVFKEPKIEYSKNSRLITFDLNNDSLKTVVRKIIDLTQNNIIISQDLYNVTLSGYIKNSEFQTGFEKLLMANKLSLNRTKDNFYIIEKLDQQKSSLTDTKNKGYDYNKTPDSNSPFNIVFHSPTNFSILSDNTPIEKLIKTVSDTLRISYIMLDKIDGNAQINLMNIDYDQFLNSIFNGSNYGYKLIDGNYLIGDNNNPLLKTSKLIKLQHRTVDKVMDLMPADLLNSLIIKEFFEQNSFVVTGNSIQIERFETFIREIDRVVPLILIEILIVEVSKTKAVSVGISAGLNGNNANANKQISPGLNYDVTPQTINNVLEKINSIGWINFGKVGNNFYLNLQALEEDSKLIIRSTPKLATLNGHEATLSSGEKKYYKEERSNYIGTQNPSLSNYYEWKPVEANLVVKIKPIVSGDDQITLDIAVEQTQFTKQGSDGSPPESVTRKFQSLIRMKNQEMVLLGGLDKLTTSTSGKGLPLLARIPVLKWIFGNNSRSKTDSRLSLFIQPTIIY